MLTYFVPARVGPERTVQRRTVEAKRFPSSRPGPVEVTTVGQNRVSRREPIVVMPVTAAMVLTSTDIDENSNQANDNQQ